MKRWMIAIGALALACAWTGRAQAEPLRVVASFSILADFARNVGGDRVQVSALVGPDSDAHVYAPTPADAKNLAQADIVIVNGLGFEGWLDRLMKSAGRKAPNVVATKGITPRKMADDDSHGHGHDHGKSDPHAWQSIANAKIYVTNIRDALTAADSAGADVYARNAAAYLAKLDALEADVRAGLARVPADRRKIITTHDAFGYFAEAYQVAFIAPLGVSTESEASAADVARIIRQIKAQKIPAVFLENVNDPRLIKRIADETGAKVGGTLYSDALTAENGPAPTYIDLIRHNIKALTGALLS